MFALPFAVSLPPTAPPTDASARRNARSGARQRPPRTALFVLLRDGGDARELFAAVPDAWRERASAVALRRYPRCDDARHLRSLLRAGRDPLATHWLPGLVAAVLGGGAIGAIVNGVLARGFGLLGGAELMLELALPLGFVLGAFLGAFTAAMAGTEAPRPGLAALWPEVRRGDTLLQLASDDSDVLRELAAAAVRLGLPSAATRR
jgi:hypothetical protein